jgi:hypothetical protein
MEQVNRISVSEDNPAVVTDVIGQDATGQYLCFSA